MLRVSRNLSANARVYVCELFVSNFCCSTHVGAGLAPFVGPNLNNVPNFAPAAAVPAVRGYLNALLPSSQALLARALVAMAQTSSPYSSDDFNGFGVERAAILQIAEADANNAIILGGDLHDSYAWTVYRGGVRTGTPVAVNLICPGVTSPGFGAAVYPFLAPIAPALGGADGVYSVINSLLTEQNPGLKFADTQNKGFYAVKATKGTHIAEFIFVTPATLLSNYSAALSASGGITANHFCGASLVTTAGVKGSLDKQANCSTIEYDTVRPAVWGLPYPPSNNTAALRTLTACNMDACVFAAPNATKAPTRAPVVAPVTIPVAPPVPPPVTAPTAPVAAPTAKPKGFFGRLFAFFKRILPG